MVGDELMDTGRVCQFWPIFMEFLDKL